MFAIVLRYADGELSIRVDELHRHPLRLFGPPPAEQLQHDVLAAHPGLQTSPKRHAPRFRQREIDVSRRPPEPERCRSDANANRAVCAVRAAVRVGARDELAGHHQALFGKIEMEDAVARGGVVRLLQPLLSRKLPTDARLLVVDRVAGEDEVVVGNRRLARMDRAAGNLVEGVDGKRRRAVRRRQQVGIHAERRARLQILGRQILVHAMRPDDLLGRRHATGRGLVRPVDRGRGLNRAPELAAADGRRSRRLAVSPLPLARAAPARTSCLA